MDCADVFEIEFPVDWLFVQFEQFEQAHRGGVSLKGIERRSFADIRFVDQYPGIGIGVVVSPSVPRHVF